MVFEIVRNDLLDLQEAPSSASISSAIECLLHPQDADDSDMSKAIDTAVRAMMLLKAQEPRVMTLEEVENALDTVVWVDRPTAKNESELFGLIQAYSRKFKFIQIKHIEMNMGEHVLYPYETYGKEWRCWDKRPTDEQRKATSW